MCIRDRLERVGPAFPGLARWAALEVLESDHRWLEFADHQYLAPADRPTPAEVAPVLAAAIGDVGPTAVFVPMGLGNPDHVMVHEASLLVRAEQPDRCV